MNLAFIIDPIEQLDPCHDTSVALMEAAQARGHQLWITQIDHLSVVGSKAVARLQPVTLKSVQLVEGSWVAPTPWFRLGLTEVKPLETMDVVVMRKDPPVTMAYFYATYILDYVDPQRTLVVNKPQGLRDANEKMYALQFRDAMPETIVTQEKDTIRQFVAHTGKAVIKPLGGKAGEGILMLTAGDRNLNSMIEISTRQGTLPVMVQAFIAAAEEGDKRIILLEGEPIGAVNRVPTGQEFRGNMATGGKVVETDITEREQLICTHLAPILKRTGLIFVGIDVIGGYLTEVNVTSPTGIREIDRLEGTHLGHQVIRWIEQARKQAVSL